MNFPSDENGEILQQMHEEGIDLTQMHAVDFFILFEQQSDANKFAEMIKGDELAPTVVVQKCKDTGVWEAVTTITMVPEHGLVSTTEQYLESLANPLKGYGDGWGIMID